VAQAVGNCIGGSMTEYIFGRTAPPEPLQECQDSHVSAGHGGAAAGKDEMPIKNDVSASGPAAQPIENPQPDHSWRSGGHLHVQPQAPTGPQAILTACDAAVPTLRPQLCRACLRSQGLFGGCSHWRSHQT